MASAATNTETIRVEVKTRESGTLFATSPDLRGLLVAEKTREALEAAIPAAVAAHYEYRGLKVEVTKVGADTWQVVTSNVLATT